VLDVPDAGLLVDHQFLLSSPGPFPTNIWDIERLLVATPVNPISRKQIFYLALSSGYSKRPRGVYKFSLARRAIIDTCAILATGVQLQVIKTKNGEQVLYSTYAVDN